MKRLFINSHLGIVHLIRSNGTTCPNGTRSMRRASVTPVQCLVYRLPCCLTCWTKESAYEEHIRYAYYFDKEEQ